MRMVTCPLPPRARAPAISGGVSAGGVSRSCVPQTARTGWRTRPSVGSGSNHGSGNRPPSAIALYIVGTVLSASGPDTPAFFRPADTAHACWRSGWCALA
ncbi:hypothetical protein, partial [Nonomuraea dietziae]|uniref:hypothetical protein n=1 Tax=Nonomuraea dietziae TaxID=65515 RepID=UPI0031D60C2E